jgi:cytochrome c-type biogenesis protein CcmE
MTSCAGRKATHDAQAAAFGQGVVAEGALDSSGMFRADTVLAKHDENYMPREVADALKKQGHWKDDYGAKPAYNAKGANTQGVSQ